MNKGQWKVLIPLLDTIIQACADIGDAKSGVGDTRDDEDEKLQNMPEGLRNGEKGQKIEETLESLNEIADFDIESLKTACETLLELQ